MRRSPITFLILCGLCVVSCSRAPVSYTDEIAQRRTDIDAFMRQSSESPVPAEKRGAFPPLLYYPIDEQYRVPAALKVVRGTAVMEMSTSTGVPRRMRRIGTLAFTLKDQPLPLTAFAEADDTRLARLFVPFGDLTNGLETYQGGRYLDLDLKGSGVYDLDFNRAYHPYCVFNPTYECPLPPKENRLPTPIRAGEKLR